MRWVPLLAAVLSLSAPLTAAAGPCVVPTHTDDPRTGSISFDDSTVECRVASSHLTDVARLRAAAGFDATTMKYMIVADDSSNAYYYQGGIYMHSGYLREAGMTPEARLATIAHEIGHGVQDKLGKLAWSREPRAAYFKRAGGDATVEGYAASPEFKEAMARSRRIEAQADLIGQEILVRAGFDANTFTRGRAVRFGCRDASELGTEGDTTHPVSAQRWVNTAISRGTVAADRGNKAAVNMAAMLGGDLKRLEAPSTDAGYKARPYTPAASVEDFEDSGRLKPGRQVAARFVVPPPADDAGFVERHATYIAGSVMDFYVAEPLKGAVDRLAARKSVAMQTLQACGTPQAERFEDSWGTSGWIARVAGDWALNLVGPKKRDPKKLTLGSVPG